MTQHEAKNAVKRIQHNAKALQAALQRDNVTMLMISIAIGSLADDVDELLRQLDERKPATPNCRPATIEELSRLCESSNVVMFPAVA